MRIREGMRRRGREIKSRRREQSSEETRRRLLETGLFPVQREALGKQKTAVCVGQLFPCANSLCALKHVRIQASSVKGTKTQSVSSVSSGELAVPNNLFSATCGFLL